MTNFDRKNVIQEIADSYVNRSLFSGIEWVAEKSGKIVLSGKSGYQNFEQKKSTVSYTHLTLPTIYSV